MDKEPKKAGSVHVSHTVPHSSAHKQLVAVLVRGKIGIDFKTRSTLDMLKLFRKNYCVVVDDTPAIRGMLDKVKNYVTYGIIDAETLNQLIEKRGELYTERVTDSKKKITYKGRFFEHNGKNYVKYMRLSCPVGGFGRAGVKKPFNQNGALGDRKDKINSLIKRML